jgi:tetratricopeptide (TPR) repeat protein
MRQWRLVRRSSAALVLVAFLLSHTTVLAHGDFHVRVAALSTRIEEQPTADHYLERSRLYRGHGDLAAALADLERAERLDPTRADLGLHRGRLALAAGRPEEAGVPLERVLAETPDHPEANLALARALADLGRSREAATHYGHAIRAAPVPIPAHYLERADALLAAGEPGAALSGLDEGLARLGPVAALANRAIEIELAQGRVDAALVRLDRLASLASRQETWLARRAEILEAAGRCAEARAAYAAVLAEVERLPPRRRATPAMRHLESRAREALAQLARAPE